VFLVFSVFQRREIRSALRNLKFVVLEHPMRREVFPVFYSKPAEHPVHRRLIAVYLLIRPRNPRESLGLSGLEHEEHRKHRLSVISARR
jgi:hypothetical protein